MHMADALVTPVVGATMYALSAAVGSQCVRKIKLEQDMSTIPLMGVMGAFVFAAQMINFTIPGTGSSGHLGGGLLLAALLGPYGGFLSMTAILFVQCLVFADGGLLAFGCNVWNMAFYSCFLGYLCIYKPMIANKITKKRIVIGSMVGSILSLQLGAFSVTLQTLLSGVTELPFQAFFMAMQPIHLAIGIGEGLVTAGVLVFLYEARPKLFLKEQEAEHKNRVSYKGILVIIATTALLISGGISLLASSNPDGLEWSIEKVAQTSELENTAETGLFKTAKSVQETTALFPDYNHKSFGNEGLGTSISGIAGSLLVAIICLLGGSIYKYIIKRKQANGQEVG